MVKAHPGRPWVAIRGLRLARQYLYREQTTPGHIQHDSGSRGGLHGQRGGGVLVNSISGKAYLYERKGAISKYKPKWLSIRSMLIEGHD